MKRKFLITVLLLSFFLFQSTAIVVADERVGDLQQHLEESELRKRTEELFEEFKREQDKEQNEGAKRRKQILERMEEFRRRKQSEEQKQEQAKEQKSETFLCVTDHVTGFNFRKSLNRWSSSKFESGQKYVIKKVKDKEFAYEVQELGVTFMLVSCNNGFNEAGSLICTGSLYEFRMNKNNLRFLLTTVPLNYRINSIG